MMVLIPELAVMDVDAAAATLRDVFGFSGDGTLLQLGDQAVALVAAERPAGHGKIDHLALAVDDVDAALAALLARGARLEATTPGGPREIAEFWETGVRYVFVQGPEGARIELCARLGGPVTGGPVTVGPVTVGPVTVGPVTGGSVLGGPVRHALPGHDHLGIPCTNIAATQAFFLSLGFNLLAANELVREDGVTLVRFLGAGSSVVELYEPPSLRGGVADFADGALWRGMQLAGSALTPGLRQGPEGLRVTVV